MDNIERLNKYINRVEGLVADTEKRIAAGEGWLDIQQDSLKYHLGNLRKQLIEATEQEKSDENFARLRPLGNSAMSGNREILENPGVFDCLLK